MPRLATRHLLLSMTICAALFAYGRIMGGISADSISPSRVIAIVAKGIAITAALVVIHACCTKWSWRSTEPGHWLAFVALWEAIDEMIIHKSLMLMACGWDEDYVVHASYATEQVINSVAFLGMATILLIGVTITKWPVYWRVAVWLRVVKEVVAGIWRLSLAADDMGWFDIANPMRNFVIPTIAVAAFVAMVVAVAIDLYQKQRRDWLHWAGLLYDFTRWYGLIRAYVL
jgi:hypothetical protein